jgi:Reverse transcriptase (RNA-dependent DNA polymerase)
VSSFDTIPHEGLMARVGEAISDGRVLSLIDGFLRQEIMSDMACWQPTTGTPQGAVLSPLLANIYLHPLDLLMEQSGCRMVRYADDFVILCRTEDEARTALRTVEAWTAANGLTLHPDKTRVADSRQPTAGARLRVSWLPVRGWSAVRAQEEPESAQGEGEGQNDAQPRRQPRADHRGPQPDAARMVRLLQTCHANPVPKP